jgi:serine/threonine-protein kinase RsbW
MDGSEMDIEIALDEALENAVVHGNYEDPDKRVYLTCRRTPRGKVSITVQDEGKGFDTGTLPDPNVPENRLRYLRRKADPSRIFSLTARLG